MTTSPLTMPQDHPNPLTPTNPPSTDARSRVSTPNSHLASEMDRNIDKFATLFSPGTPRASPVFETTNDYFNSAPSVGPSNRAAIPKRPHSAPRAIPLTHSRSESDSEFGSFVAVPAMEDPLSADIPTFEYEHLQAPMQATSPAQLHPPASASRSRTGSPSSLLSSQQPSQRQGDNTSLNFFDKFAEDAKKASERRGRELVDELLMYEDDPMYWLKNQQAEVVDKAKDEHGPGPGSSPLGTNAVTTHETPFSPARVEHGFHSDIDDEYFSPKARAASHSPHRTKRESSHSSQSPPIGSLLSTAPPTLAPPVASTPLVNSVPLSSSPPDDATLGSSGTPSSRGSSSSGHRPVSPPRSSSYQTLSSLSSRWMSNLLSSTSNPSSTASASRASTTARPTLDSIFGAPEDGEPTHPQTPPSQARAHAPTHHAQTLPRPIGGPSTHNPLPTSLAHGGLNRFGSPVTSQSIPNILPISPFSADISHKSSPFASHTFKPISGAPGFTGEQYDWDKGFSKELESELGGKGDRGRGEGVLGEEHWGRAQMSGGSLHSSRTASEGVRELIEKKIGGVDLVGRRATTTPVLTSDLADLIRPHFPALARLPRNWNLLYSLDQDGISLNTLYSNCEAAAEKDKTHSGKGTLVVVRDAGDTIFGVYVGEGLAKGGGRGKGYFGGGESFLWKYTGGALKVYKWTGKNDYVALCEYNCLSFGGGDGHYGLYLDDTLYEGSSAPCPTFDNGPLCSPGPFKAGCIEFECVGLEVWGIGA
ncbi:TLD-domain-containing protein [Crucibulum laeve]|uniref:Oxidation resistance protein 1 n=1 Tax=Crucibulum laeve TaxID=68775 RepID=A0A5C3LZB5_9AGAR|nr:TLD-domain-containing protein [Crucibulum laeve]